MADLPLNPVSRQLPSNLDSSWHRMHLDFAFRSYGMSWPFFSSGPPLFPVPFFPALPPWSLYPPSMMMADLAAASQQLEQIEPPLRSPMDSSPEPDIDVVGNEAEESFAGQWKEETTVSQSEPAVENQLLQTADSTCEQDQPTTVTNVMAPIERDSNLLINNLAEVIPVPAPSDEADDFVTSTSVKPNDTYEQKQDQPIPLINKKTLVSLDACSSPGIVAEVFTVSKNTDDLATETSTPQESCDTVLPDNKLRYPLCEGQSSSVRGIITKPPDTTDYDTEMLSIHERAPKKPSKAFDWKKYSLFRESRPRQAKSICLTRLAVDAASCVNTKNDSGVKSLKGKKKGKKSLQNANRLPRIKVKRRHQDPKTITSTINEVASEVAFTVTSAEISKEAASVSGSEVDCDVSSGAPEKKKLRIKLKMTSADRFELVQILDKVPDSQTSFSQQSSLQVSDNPVLISSTCRDGVVQCEALSSRRKPPTVVFKGSSQPLLAQERTFIEDTRVKKKKGKHVTFALADSSSKDEACVTNEVKKVSKNKIKLDGVKKHEVLARVLQLEQRPYSPRTDAKIPLINRWFSSTWDERSKLNRKHILDLFDESYAIQNNQLTKQMLDTGRPLNALFDKASAKTSTNNKTIVSILKQNVNKPAGKSNSGVQSHKQSDSSNQILLQRSVSSQNEIVPKTAAASQSKSNPGGYQLMSATVAATTTASGSGQTANFVSTSTRDQNVVQAMDISNVRKDKITMADKRAAEAKPTIVTVSSKISHPLAVQSLSQYKIPRVVKHPELATVATTWSKSTSQLPSFASCDAALPADLPLPLSAFKTSKFGDFAPAPPVVPTAKKSRPRLIPSHFYTESVTKNEASLLAYLKTEKTRLRGSQRPLNSVSGQPGSRSHTLAGKMLRTQAFHCDACNINCENSQSYTNHCRRHCHRVCIRPVTF